MRDIDMKSYKIDGERLYKRCLFVEDFVCVCHVPVFLRDNLELAVDYFTGGVKWQQQPPTLWESFQTEPGCNERRYALSIRDVPPPPITPVRATENLVTQESRWSEWRLIGYADGRIDIDRDGEPMVWIRGMALSEHPYTARDVYEFGKFASCAKL